MTRRKKPETPISTPTFDDEPTGETKSTEWDAADAEWAKEQAKGTEADEPPFPGRVLRETQRELDAKLDAQEKRYNESVGTVTTSLPVEVEPVHSEPSEDLKDGIKRGLAYARDCALATIDEYVERCTSGGSLSLAEVRELRSRVAAL